MTEAKTRIFRLELLALGRRLEHDVGNLTAEVFSDTGVKASANPCQITLEYPTDRGPDTYDEEVAIDLLQEEGPRQGEIRAALARIDSGTFGRCEDCGKPISLKRLGAIPFARQCIACAVESEQANSVWLADDHGPDGGPRARGHKYSAPLGRKVRDRALTPATPVRVK
jgi:DnaK suppressor protein